MVPGLNLGNSSEKSNTSQKSVTSPTLTSTLSGTGPSLQSNVTGAAGSIYNGQNPANATLMSPILKTDLTGAPTGHATSGTSLSGAVSALQTAIPSGQVSIATTPSIATGVSGAVPVLHTTLPSGQVPAGTIPTLPIGVSGTMPVLHTSLPSGQVPAGTIPTLPIGVSGIVPSLQANLPGSPTDKDANKTFSKPTIPAINMPAVSSGSASGTNFFSFVY